ncbi:Autoinducer 2 sensor kinase/phosphatase LuxQ [Rosistilla carotiformis]|uniref:histidine kinase n=1 Tax=Rosistilla carotiformis TaxID=2528017 RepID=A0A518K079_9BACT|nr:PAS domain-containing protein [Rosistilla carotiformis]QDV71213.1 Autoinducer 2 sensor kinase/phosphatase LuxQ [Rosistilla carotiformis]
MKAIETSSNRIDPTAGPLIVGVGASAGGLEAFQELLRALGDADGLAIVFVQHLDPSSETLLNDLLAGATTLEIIPLSGRKKLKSGKVYVCPSHKSLQLKNGSVSVVDPPQSRQQPAPIDGFFHSIAEDQGELGIGVILSGAGSDGTLGLKAISDRGGLTFAQDAASAKYDSMPRSAATTGVADHILKPAEIATELLRYHNHLQSVRPPAIQRRLQDQIEEAIPMIAETLLKVTEHDFQHYKFNTLARRIQRRMQVLKVAVASDYVDYLQHHDEEALALFQELLIGVTTFFRDPEAFSVLAEQVLPKLFENRGPDDCVRIWVAGCANGSEAYTMAILCREAMDALPMAPEVQIFATDIDERALNVARVGSYPIGIEEHVSAERLQRFFVKRGKRYQVAKEIRDIVLFSTHNLIHDPPFSRQDLICCRNLLIYLGPHLQNKLIPLFHYALRPSGYLFLGPSENITSHGELFRPIDARLRISQRKGTAARSHGLQTEMSPRRSGRPPQDPEVDLTEMMQKIALDEFTPKTAVIDASGNVLTSSSNISKYLSFAGGPMQTNIVKLADSGLRIGLRAAIAEAKKLRRRVEHENLSIRVGDLVQRVMLTVQPMPQLGEDEPLLMVVFHDVGLPYRRDDVEAEDDSSENGVDSIIAQMERELETVRSDLDRSMQDMEAANEELKSSNEELLSMNEELQSANEELEASKEEIRIGSDATARANADLQNLLRSTQIATVFLDQQLLIRSYTPAIREIYGLISTDIGRPLEMFVPYVEDMPPLPDPAMIQDGQPIEHTVVARSGKSFIRRVLNYRSHTGQAEGLVTTFTDVTELRNSHELFQSLVDVSAQIVWIANAEGNIIEDSPSWRAFTGQTYEQWRGRGWVDVIHPDDHAITLSTWETCLDTGEPFSAEYRLKHVSGVWKWNHVRAVCLRRHDGTIRRWVGMNIDIDARKRAELNYGFLADLQAQFSPLMSDRDLMEVAVQRTAHYLGLSRCCIVEFDAEAESAEVLYEHHDPELQSIVGTHRVKDFHSEQEQKMLAAGQQVLQNDTQAEGIDPTLAKNQRDIQIHAFCNSAYVTEQKVRFVVSAIKSEPYCWQPDDLSLLQEIANRLCIRIERARAEMETKRREAHLRRVINNQLGLVGVIGRDGRLLEVDDRSINIAGLKREDVIGKHFAECPWWTYDARVAQQMRDAMDRAFAGQRVRFDVGLYAQGNDRLMIDFMIAPVLGDDGQVEYLIPSGVDISDRKAAEDQVRAHAEQLSTERTKLIALLADYQKNEQYLKLSLNAGRLGSWQWIPGNNQLTLSDELLEIFGMKAAHYDDSFEASLQIIHPEDRDFAASQLRALLEGTSNEFRFDWRIVRADNGNVCWTETRGLVTRDSQGQPVSLTGITSDVTDRKIADLALVESNQRMSMALKAGGMAAWEWSENKSVWEPAMFALLGIEPIENPTIDLFFQYVYPDDVAALREVWGQAANDQEDYDTEFRIVRSNGEVRWLAGVGTVICDDRGNVVRMHGLNWDITDEKQSELAIKLSEERLRSAAEAAGFGMLHADLMKGTVTYSQELKRLVGIDDADDEQTEVPIGEMLNWVHPDDRAACDQHYRELVEHPHTAERSIDHRIVCPNGDIRWVRLQAKPLFTGDDADEDSQATQLIGTLLDITRQRQFELSLKEAREQAVAANESKSAFLANMSHEIRTPMTAILGYTDLIAEKVNDDETLAHVRTIRRNGDFLLDIINDILDISKIEAGKFDISHERFAPNRLVEDVRSIMEVRASERKLDLDVEYHGLIPSEIQSDPKRLKQILINLVGNAIKFTTEGCVNIVVRFLPGEMPRLQFDVVDSGIGMSEKQKRRLFQPFSQGDGNVNREFGGTGLGLAISKRLTEMLGGEISVQSNLSQGSRFTITIATGDVEDVPMIQPQLAIDSKPTEPGKEKEIRLNCQLLVVDDRRDIRFLSRTLLAKAGADVDEAEDGQVAITMVKEKAAAGEHYDLILLDMQMPRLDGYQTAQQLRKLGFSGPIIALTADAMQGDMTRCIECGCNDYLSKPIDVERLTSMVHRLTSALKA